MMPATDLPTGAALRALPKALRDERGAIEELDRASWHPDVQLSQWTRMTYAAGSLRGMHVHIEHSDVVLVTEGELWVWLVDLRRDAPTAGARCQVTLAASAPASLFIPHGVLHGLYATEPAVMLIGTTREYDPHDDLGTRFDDPALALSWPDADPILSERDRDASSLAAMLAQLGGRGIDAIPAPG